MKVVLRVEIEVERTEFSGDGGLSVLLPFASHIARKEVDAALARASGDKNPYLKDAVLVKLGVWNVTIDKDATEEANKK